MHFRLKIEKQHQTLLYNLNINFRKEAINKRFEEEKRVLGLMMNNKKRFLLPFFIFTLLFNLLPISCVRAIGAEMPSENNNIITAPQITSIEHRETELLSHPLIKGLSEAGTEVMVYIDGTYSGNALIEDMGEEKESFSFRPSSDLSAGLHSVFIIAKDPTSLRLSPPSREFSIYIIPLPAPTLIQPNEQTITSNPRQLITGLTVSNTRVHIYIDGVHNGITANISDKSGTANFAYRPFLNLSVGKHVVWAVAEDSLGRMSKKSNILYFKIEAPYPAPILFVPNKNNINLVSGLAKNNSRVKIFVDKKLDGEFEVVNNESGTANFAYQLRQELSAKKHLIFATAIDKRGKESPWSNFIYINGRKELTPTISEKAAEENVSTGPSAEKETKLLSAGRLNDLIVLAEIYAGNKDVRVKDSDLADVETAIQNKDKLNIKSADLKLLEALLEGKKEEMSKGAQKEPVESIKSKATSTAQTDKEISEINNILKQSQATGSEKTGLINESKENQSKLKLNLIIFIAFLLAVIVWIFWVNRELIKERREQNEASGRDKKDKKDKMRL